MITLMVVMTVAGCVAIGHYTNANSAYDNIERATILGTGWFLLGFVAAVGAQMLGWL